MDENKNNKLIDALLSRFPLIRKEILAGPPDDIVRLIIPNGLLPQVDDFIKSHHPSNILSPCNPFKEDENYSVAGIARVV
ncbi:hypothetical protein [Paenibacillus sp. MMO-177]|uniref:hypothetical protein n=1 Tax=Paenibacillus sp. MMO-177 TaxID=3081289 RepID=UPI00301A68EE